jgi:hypothetical protein
MGAALDSSAPCPPTLENLTATLAASCVGLDQLESVMNIRFVTKTVHAFLDYPVALSLVATPFLLGLGRGDPLALWVSVATGVAAFILTLFTDHKTGVIRVLPYWLHVAVDRLVGIIFVAVPFALGLQGLDAWYYWVNGATVLLVTFVLNAPESGDRTMKPVQA